MNLKENYTKHVLGASSLNAGIGGQDEKLVSAAQFSLLARYGITNQDSVLELGCGTGRLLISLGDFLRANGSYLGIDLIDQLVDFTSNRISEMKLDMQRFRVNRMQNEMDYPDAKFDFICAFSVYTHMEPEDIYNSMKALANCSKPTTTLFVTFLGIETVFGSTYFRAEAELEINARYSRVRNVAISKSYAVELAKLAGWKLVDIYWQELSNPYENGVPITNQTYLVLMPDKSVS